MQPSLLREAADLAERGVACALAVVVAAAGSVPGKVGATMLVTVDGTSRGTVGGAGLEERVKALCRDALQRGEGSVQSFDLANWKEGGLDSVCGGTVQVAIHVLHPAPHVLLVGGGHCSLALAQVLDVLAWPYSVVDSRAGYADAQRFPRARETIHAPPARHLAAVEDLSRFTHVYVMGHSHEEDGEALLTLLTRGFPGAIGVIGSRSKMHAFRERARARNVPDAAFARVRSPIGLDIGATTPAEIAVAIAAEIVADVKARAPRGAPATGAPSPLHPRSSQVGNP